MRQQAMLLAFAIHFIALAVLAATELRSATFSAAWSACAALLLFAAGRQRTRSVGLVRSAELLAERDALQDRCDHLEAERTARRRRAEQLADHVRQRTEPKEGPSS